MGHPVRIPKNMVSSALHARSREPFTDILACIIAAEPDLEAIKAFANRYPNKWAQAVQIFAHLAGYHDKLQVNSDITLGVLQMSDAELMVRLAEAQARLEDLGGENVIPLPPAKRDGNN